MRLGTLFSENPGGKSRRPVSSMWQAGSWPLLAVCIERTKAYWSLRAANFVHSFGYYLSLDKKGKRTKGLSRKARQKKKAAAAAAREKARGGRRGPRGSG